MKFVLDASVTLAWAFEDEAGDQAQEVLAHLRTGKAVAPALWPLEISNGLLVAERRKRITRSDAARFASLLMALPIVVEPPDRRRIFETVTILARRHGLSAYDAHYLELALRQGIPLATLDETLQKAAVSEGVGIFLS